MESQRVIQIWDTIITEEMQDQVEAEHYRYYYLPPGVKPWSKLSRYAPDEDTMMMARGTKAWQRLIFTNDERYTEFEEQKYEQALEYIEKHEIGTI